LFAADENVYTWADVVRLARLRSVWNALVEDVRAGEAAMTELEARGVPIGDDEIEEAGRAFRYGRDLLASEELADWLRRHGLTMEDWHGYLGRSLAKDRVSPGRGAHPGADGEDAAWAEGICSGRLERLALELADMVAVSPGIPLELLDDAFDAFCRRTAGEASFSSEVETNRLEWSRVDYATISLDGESAAHEAALCMRADGESIADVARRAAVEVEEHLEWLEEIDVDLATRFLAAGAGDVVGPVAVGDRFVVARLRARTPPSVEDEAVRERARHSVVTRAVARAVNDRITWLERP
jgi:hypothetical protein